ncbi:uncharacterized protein HMPREF1541_03063 [Cyphellophora europaea CBS 101466]|uniref:Uncharacterized protein n=1 Tax=Cyphellophora europaea (strain CBS 101466) TaxID=1220924 RepID=W2RZC5_CYPE1|nr:uncharacterized protein HMPREF1541_03063 [Cyphellophora europaea CBS 101466]ETN41128.1 hypothetical protein HMPREF1541_03063 [Cyphellophora europaea CBS 101466]
MPTSTPTSTPNEILATRLLSLASKRAHPKTLCPSEVARSFSTIELSSQLDVSAWRDLMPSLRSLCFQMRERGELEILQKGEVLVGDDAVEGEVRGPIRVRLVAGGTRMKDV